MESLEGSASALVGFTVRRTRSSGSRRPRVLCGTSHSFTFLPPSTNATISLSNVENPSFRNVGSPGASVTENKLKLKLKLVGVTQRIQTIPIADIYGDGSTYHSQASKPDHKSVFQDNEQRLLPNKGKGNGLQQRHVQKMVSLGEVRQDRGNPFETVNGTFMSESVQRSKRVLKKRVPDVELDSDDGDEEIRYLEKLKSKRTSRDWEAGEDETSKRIHGIYGNKHYMEEEEPLSEEKPGSQRKKPRIGIIDSFQAGAKGPAPTTRTRALQSGRDAASVSGSILLEFPDGLPSAPSRRQKQKLSEVEQQSKKAEAAQRRRMQSEKAAREAEAEAIRKILGQDSGRKKREEKMKKQQEELAQERAVKSETLASNTVRWVIGPNGTTVTFSQDVGLPDIFKRVPCSYPPPREKCVGPNCTKAYKYRDSKSKLPLCSLHCYKAVQEKMHPLIAC